MFLWSIHPSREASYRGHNLNNDCIIVTLFTLGIPNPLMATHKIARLPCERESMDPSWFHKKGRPFTLAHMFMHQHKLTRIEEGLESALKHTTEFHTRV